MSQQFLRNIEPARFVTTLALTLALSPFAVAASPAPFSYELVGVARYDGVSYASIFDPQTGYHFLLSTLSPSERGLILASVATDDDPAGPSATIHDHGSIVTLSLGENAAIESAPTALLQPVSAAPAPLVSQDNTPQLNHPKPPAGATLPLVFQEVDPARMTLTAEQKTTLAQLRQDFISDVSGAAAGTTSNATNANPTGASSSPVTSQAGGNQNSSSDATYRNWLTAQEKSDAMFRMLFGTQAFNAYTESISYPAGP